MRWSLLANPCVVSMCMIGSAFGQDPLIRPAREMLVDGPAQLWDVELYDLDGDGDLDLYTDGERFGFAPSGGDPRVYLYDDLGGFSELAGAVDPAVGGEPHSDLRFADLEGDGDADAYRVSWFAGQQDQVLLGDGTGKLALGPGGGTASESPWAVALADLDLDGDVDALSDDSAGGSYGFLVGLRVHVNGGAATFTTSLAPLPPSSSIKGGDIAVGDVDADGLPDAVVSTGDSYPQLALNGPGLAFAHAPGALPFDAKGHEVELGDLDGDGALDLAFGTRDVFGFFTEAEPDLLYRGDGLGTFTLAAVLPGGARATTALGLGDFDGDADLDIVLSYGASSERTGQVLLRNDGGFAFAGASQAFEKVPRDCEVLALGDVDQDGDGDLVLAQDDAQSRFLLGDGALGFAEAASAQPWSDADGAILLADLDGDGDLDGWASIEKAQVQRNLGNGVLVPDDAATAGAVPAHPAGGSFALAFDCNGDGALDVYEARETSSYDDQLYVNNGSGAFTNDHMVASSHTAATSDIDGDGDADLVLDGAQLGLGDGAGGFSFGSPWFPALGGAEVSAFGDLDQDGDLDLVRGLASGPPVWNADVGADFGPDQPLGAAIEPKDLAVSDLDADGDADVLFATLGGPVLRRNDGAGVFTDVSASLPAHAVTYWLPRVAAADLDDDGDHDFVATTSNMWSSEKYFLYLSQPGGVFTDGTSSVQSDLEGPIDIAAGDVDGDLDLDLVATHLSGSLRVLTNHTRQVAWRGLPRAGKYLALDVSGPQGEPWLLAISPGLASIPLAPFGLLQLDPAGLKVVASGLLDAAGQAAVVEMMPAGPGAVGQTVYAQAVVGFAPRFANLEVVTLTAY